MYKSGSRKSFDNYRPISVLPILSKIFEKCVYRQLVNHLENNNLLSNFQFGFRSRRSEIAATFFTDNIRSAMDEGKYTGAIYIDLSKAFDTISHSILLKTLHNYGISGRSNEWLADYLFCRSQQVSYLGTLSSPQSTFCGVPQGSILGPLLFIVYFNDAANTIVNSKILMYADDTVLFCSHKDINTVHQCLEDDFRLLSQWLKDNELIVTFKKGKPEVMVFGTHPSVCQKPEETSKRPHQNRTLW